MGMGGRLWGLDWVGSSSSRSRSPENSGSWQFLPHTHVFRPRAYVGSVQGLPSPLLRVTPVTRGEAREKNQGQAGEGCHVLCCSRTPLPSSLSCRDLLGLCLLSLCLECLDPQIRTSSQSSKPFPMVSDSPSGGPRRLQEHGDEVCPLSCSCEKLF